MTRAARDKPCSPRAPRGSRWAREWSAAIEFGVDGALIESNARLTPAERLRELAEMNRLHAEIQSRTLSAEERERLRVMELRDKLARLGPELVSGLAPGLGDDIR